MKYIKALHKKQQHGSFPRCLCFMTGDRPAVAERLADLVALPEFTIGPEDFWMPSPILAARGDYMKETLKEAVLLDATGPSKNLLKPEKRDCLRDWWLAVPQKANSPNWDIASTCKIGGKPGLLLIEAKAHAGELKTEGKSLRGKKRSDGSVQEPSEHAKHNHEQIGRAIDEVSARLRGLHQGWTLCRDSHYQLANRFAWAWKLASINVPVVMVYLGFLGANDMKGRELFLDSADWTRVLLDHSRSCVPEEIWEREIKVGDCSFRALIRARKQYLSASDTGAN